MRHGFIVLAAAGIFSLLSVSEASAQRFGFSFGNRGTRGFSNSYGNGSYYGGNNYYPNSYGYSNYGNQSYSPYYQGNTYGTSLRLGNFGFSQSYSTPYYSQSYYSQPYYSSMSSYPVLSTTYQESPSSTPVIVQSNYSSDQAYATINVSVPTADAQVWFGDTLMAQQGIQRTYQSTLLDAGTTYAYTITARWQQDGKMQEQSRKIEVFADRTSEVKFGSSHRQLTPSPMLSNGK